MKNIFNGYYPPSKNEFETLWRNAIFVFDTNVLLNLYRYQASTRDSLLSVIEKLSDRVWIPYHAGLEFQRNRLHVIAAQRKRYSEVKSIISKSISGLQNELDNLQLKKRHSHIDPEKLIVNINRVKDDFLSELDTLEKQSTGVTSLDEIRNKIDKLFEGKVGSAPTGQNEIDILFKEADIRYKNNIPPGFEDSNKDDRKPDDFTYGGITYKRKYGDIIIWKQIIKHAKNNSLKDVIFITDDNKSDWWWQIESNGKKTIGVRPELTDELKRDAGVERFYVYNTEGFLSYANEQIGAQVTDEAIEEVREVSISHRSHTLDPHISQRLAISTENAVFNWLHNMYPGLQRNISGSPDFTCYEGEHRYGFEVLLIRNLKVISKIINSIHKSYFILKEYEYYEMSLIVVVLKDEDVDWIKKFLNKRLDTTVPNLRIIIGKAEFYEDSSFVYGFTPYIDTHSNKNM